MRRIITVAFVVFLAGCNMTPEQKQRMEEAVEAAANNNAAPARQPTPTVQCQRMGNPNEPIMTYEYHCPVGYMPK